MFMMFLLYIWMREKDNVVTWEQKLYKTQNNKRSPAPLSQKDDTKTKSVKISIGPPNPLQKQEDDP